MASIINALKTVPGVSSILPASLTNDEWALAYSRLEKEAVAAQKPTPASANFNPTVHSLSTKIKQRLRLAGPIEQPRDENTHKPYELHTPIIPPASFNYPYQSEDRAPPSPIADPSSIDLDTPNVPKLNSEKTQFDSKGASTFNDLKDTKMRPYWICGKDYTQNIQTEMITGAIELARTTHHTKTLVKDGTTYDDLLATLLLKDEVLNPHIPMVEYGKVTVDTLIKPEAPPGQHNVTNFSCLPSINPFTEKKHSETYYRGRAYITNKRLILLSANTEQSTTVKNSVFFGFSINRTDYDGISYRHFPIETLQGAHLSSFIGANGQSDIKAEYPYGCGLCCISCCMPPLVNCCIKEYKAKIVKTGTVNMKEVTIGFKVQDSWPFWGSQHGTITLHLEPQSPVAQAARFVGGIQGSPVAKLPLPGSSSQSQAGPSKSGANQGYSAMPGMQVQSSIVSSAPAPEMVAFHIPAPTTAPVSVENPYVPADLSSSHAY